MIPISDFIVAEAAQRKRDLLTLAIIMCVMILYFALLFSNVKPITAFISHHFTPRIASILQGLLTLPLLFIILGGMWLGSLKGNNDVRLKCSHCEKHLYNSTRLVIATKNCPFCGKIVLYTTP